MNNWNNLSMKERSELMRIYRKMGITNLLDMKLHYNTFKDGYDESHNIKKPVWVEEDQSYHSFSRNPETGLLLKEHSYPTFKQGVKEDIELGYQPYINTLNNRFYSLTSEELQEKEYPWMYEQVNKFDGKSTRSNNLKSPQIPNTNPVQDNTGRVKINIFDQPKLNQTPETFYKPSYGEIRQEKPLSPQKVESLEARRKAERSGERKIPMMERASWQERKRVGKTLLDVGKLAVSAYALGAPTSALGASYLATEGIKDFSADRPDLQMSQNLNQGNYKQAALNLGEGVLDLAATLPFLSPIVKNKYPGVKGKLPRYPLMREARMKLLSDQFEAMEFARKQVIEETNDAQRLPPEDYHFVRGYRELTSPIVPFLK